MREFSKSIIKNSLILAMYKIWHNVAMILFTIALVVLCFVLGLLSFPIVVTLFFSLICLFNNFIVYPLLVKYVAAPADPSDKPRDEDDKIFSDERRIK